MNYTLTLLPVPLLDLRLQFSKSFPMILINSDSGSMWLVEQHVVLIPVSPGEDMLSSSPVIRISSAVRISYVLVITRADLRMS